MAPAAPSVSIVIPAYNEQEQIRACVLAAINQTSPALEIIVVDNKSTDETATIVAELQADHPGTPLLYIRQDEEQGLVPTRNLGMNRARGDIIGRIDADSVITANWVAEVRAAFADPDVAAATGPVAYYDMPLQRFGLRADDTVRRVMLALAREYHFVFGSNMALRASAWRAIRGEVCRDLDDEFHEDIDISVHLVRHSLRAKYVPSMVAGISARRIDDSPRDYYRYVTRFERTYKKHRVRNVGVRAPMLLFLALYPALKALRLNRTRKGEIAA